MSTEIYRILKIESMVACPIMNYDIAARYIQDNATKADPANYIYMVNICRVSGIGPDVGKIKRKYLFRIINSFMLRYPRGKGTKGDEFLRTFYSACYTIISETSRNSHWKPLGYWTPSEKGKEVMLRFNSVDEEMTDFSGISTGTINGLINVGLVSGWFNEKGHPERMWLTDKGAEHYRAITFQPDNILRVQLR